MTLPKDNQITFSASMVLTIVTILAAGLASYYGGRLSIEQNFSDLRDRVTKAEASISSIDEVKLDLANSKQNISNLWVGVSTLLQDRGYDPVKILGNQKI